MTPRGRPRIHRERPKKQKTSGPQSIRGYYQLNGLPMTQQAQLLPVSENEEAGQLIVRFEAPRILVDGQVTYPAVIQAEDENIITWALGLRLKRRFGTLQVPHALVTTPTSMAYVVPP